MSRLFPTVKLSESRRPQSDVPVAGLPARFTVHARAISALRVAETAERMRESKATDPMNRAPVHPVHSWFATQRVSEIVPPRSSGSKPVRAKALSECAWCPPESGARGSAISET